MLIFTKEEGEKIRVGEKLATLRPLRANGKGYARVGSIHQVRTGRDFKAPFLCKILILDSGFLNIESLTDGDAFELGYDSVDAYLSQDYNKRNPSPERVKYTFVCLDHLLAVLDDGEWTPDLFAFVYEAVNICPDLVAGVDPETVFEGCDLDDLEEALGTLQANLREVVA